MVAQETRARAFDRLLDPVRDALTPEVAQALIDLRADPATQALLDDYADRNTEGLLSADELGEYEALVYAIDLISILQAKARAMLKSRRAS